MSDAEQAFEAARREILRVREAGEEDLDLFGKEYDSLTTLPGEVGTLERVTYIDLGNTQITDLTPLAPLTGLTFLILRNTPVHDITPLAGLSRLSKLDLGNTRVADIAPLRDLSALEALSINGTEVADLRPLIPLTELGAGENAGLWYADTPASRATPELARLSKVEDNNWAKCYRDTRAYLLTLPPWPAPLPWDVPAGEPLPNPSVPENQTAPMRVIEEDGVLRVAAPGDGLAEGSSDLARQGWQALREFLEDLAHMRGRVSNAMPTLDRALGRLDGALGDDYDAMNPVAVGTHGNRVIRQAGLAGDVLMDADAAEIEEFAAALALFLERFIEWRTYRDDATNHPITPEDALLAAAEIEELAQVFENVDVIDGAIPAELQTQIADVRDAPDDPIASKGLVASASNVLAGAMARLMPVWKTCVRELRDVGSQSWSAMKKGAAVSVAGSVGSLGLIALDLLFTKGTNIATLATKFPNHLGWLKNLLTGFGLL